MSLLLQALQKAAKSREEGDAEPSAETVSIANGLELEPTPAASRHSAPAAAASPAHAATVVQASNVPGFDAIDYAREHYMLTFVAGAFILALGYGMYVYLQINRPFGSSSSPLPVAVIPAPQAPIAQSSPALSNAKVSGLPVESNIALQKTEETAVSKVKEEPVGRIEPAASLVSGRPYAAKAPARKDRTFGPESTPVPMQSESLPLKDASDSIETVVIPATHAKPSGDISVRRDTAGVTPINPTLMQGYEALQQGDTARAKELYGQVLHADPRNMDALLGMGAIATSDGRIEDATRYYRQALELDPRNAYAQAGLISIVGGADLPAAESRLKQLISRDPSAFLYFSLGNLYAEQAQWPSAQQAYFQAFQLQSDNADYAFNLAIGLEHLGQNRQALDYYRKALDLSFKKGRASFDQSLVIQRVGQLSTRVEQ